jgi:hypothetical protein
MTSQPRAQNTKPGLTQATSRVASAVEAIRKTGSTGEMALQSLFGHPTTQSMQQGLVRLVGHRAPAQMATTPRPAT